MKGKIPIAIAGYSLVVTFLYVVMYFLFLALDRANKVSPALGAVYVYGRVLLTDTIPAAIMAFCSIGAFKYLRGNNYGLSSAIVVTIICGVLVLTHLLQLLTPTAGP
jgi:hypothetical protein